MNIYYKRYTNLIKPFKFIYPFYILFNIFVCVYVTVKIFYDGRQKVKPQFDKVTPFHLQSGDISSAIIIYCVYYGLHIFYYISTLVYDKLEESYNLDF